MELAFDRIENKHFCTDDDGNYLDVDDWLGVFYSEQNETEIASLYLGQDLDEPISGEMVGGAVDSHYLPSSVQHIYLDCNVLAGSLPVAQLPENLREPSISHNKLSGSLDLTKLPPLMVFFNGSRNRFSGEVDISHLPSGMLMLFIYDNQLTGGLCFDALPESIQQIDVHRNRFSGSLTAAKLPRGLHKTQAEYNLLSGVLIVQFESKTAFTLSGNKVLWSTLMEHLFRKKSCKQSYLGNANYDFIICFQRALITE